MKNKIPIFYYHSVGYQPPETILLRDFKRHLETLRELGFKTVTVSDLFKKNYQENERVAALTFDDGLLDNFEIAAPLLREYGFTATFFVIPGFDNITRWVNPQTKQWSNTTKAGYSIPYQNMQKEHRKELLEMGMEIGSHTFNHEKLAKIPPRQAKEELTRSKKKLEDELGIPVESFCYPFGSYNSAVAEMVKEAGYLGATTTIPGYFSTHKHPYKIGRFLVKNPYFFREVLNGKAFSLLHFLKSAANYRQLKKDQKR